MSRDNLHHVPVVTDKQLEGLVSSSDLLRHQGQSHLHLIRQLHRAGSYEELVELGQTLPELQFTLVHNQINSLHTSQIISACIEAMLQKIITLTEQELGPSPIDYCWVAVGSLARDEMHAFSDQDSALLLADEYNSEHHAEYFTQLANTVVKQMARCGIKRCPGDMMASNPLWRQPVNKWQSYFTQWIENPDHQELMLACNFFDMRVISGNDTLFHDLQHRVLGQAQSNQIFLTHLAAAATRHTPPIGFFRQFVLARSGEHENQLDIKTNGIMAIVELARLFALAAGARQTNTVDRLQQGVKHNQISQDMQANLSNALLFLTRLRHNHQMQQAQSGNEVNNFIEPDTLSPLERSYLKDIFSVIKELHETIAIRYQTGRIT